MHALIHWSIFLNAIGSGKGADLSIQIARFTLPGQELLGKLLLPRFPHHFKNNIRTPAGYREAPLRISAGVRIQWRALRSPLPGATPHASTWHRDRRKPHEQAHGSLRSSALAAQGQTYHSCFYWWADEKIYVRVKRDTR